MVGSKKLEQFCAIAKTYRVKRLLVATTGCVVEFYSPDNIPNVTEVAAIPPLNLTSDGQPTDEEMMLWSAEDKVGEKPNVD